MEKYCFKCGEIIKCREEYDNYCGKCGGELGHVIHTNKDESGFIVKEPDGGYIHTFCDGKVNVILKNIAKGTAVFFCTRCGFRVED